MNALRGHSNIQGLTDLGLLSNQLPGYISLPARRAGLRQVLGGAHIETAAAKPVELLAKYAKFFVSFMKTWWGDAATAQNQLGL